MFSFMATAVILTASPPYEFEVDCSSWQGERLAEIHYRYVARDGQVCKNSIQLFPGSDALDAANGLMGSLKFHGWRFETLDDKRFVIRGSKKAPIRSIQFESDQWVPVYSVRPVGPFRAPPPRAVNR